MDAEAKTARERSEALAAILAAGLLRWRRIRAVHALLKPHPKYARLAREHPREVSTS